jgi:hypothetical protein
MSAKAEFITATAFAAIMVLIGLGAIWIVRWQTYFLLRHQGEPRGSLPLSISANSSQPGHDLERGPRLPIPIEAAGGSAELAAAHPTSDNNDLGSGPTVVDTQHTSTDRLSYLSDTTVVDETWQETKTCGSKGTPLQERSGGQRE